MKKMTRRTVLKAGTALAGGMAGILATGRAPAFAQGTTVHWIRWNDFVPASDTAAAARAAARGREGARHQDQLRDRQRQRPAAAHHGGDPVGRRPRPVHAQQQPPAALCREPGRSRGCRRAARQGRGRPLCAGQGRISHDGSKWLSMPFAIIGGMIAYRKSWFDEVGATKFPDDLGGVPRGRQEAQGQGAADRPDARPHLRRQPDLHLSLHVVVGRQGSRGRRQDRQPQQQGRHRVGQVHDGVLEGCASTRAGSPGTTPTTTARSSPARSPRR